MRSRVPYLFLPCLYPGLPPRPPFDGGVRLAIHYLLRMVQPVYFTFLKWHRGGEAPRYLSRYRDR
jgi:hypothetical protein